MFTLNKRSVTGLTKFFFAWQHVSRPKVFSGNTETSKLRIVMYFQ